ncbi:hypothetical protein ACS0TY_034844 [Phlomoides rotata]
MGDLDDDVLDLGLVEMLRRDKVLSSAYLLGQDDREWVFKSQPWHFDGNSFAIKMLSGLERPSSVHVSSASFWVRAHDIPLMCRSETVIYSVANKIRN